MSGSCLFKAGILLLLSFIEIHGDNLCTGIRSSGLLADLFDKDPTTGVNLKNTSNATEIHQCCTQAKYCPNLNFKRHKRATVIDFDSELQRNFANRLCPVGWRACRYDQNQVDADPSIEDTCISLTGVRCWTGGFGAIKNGGKETLILQKVDVPIFPNRTQCEVEITKAIREVTKRPKLGPTKLTQGELCAGGEPGKDSCSGDGGSPLVCQAVSGSY